MPNVSTWNALLLLLLLACTACGKKLDQIEPTMLCSISSSAVAKLPSPLPPLSPKEKTTDWGKEIGIATSFAKEGDFYRAITSFKRAKFLLDASKRDATSLQYIDWSIFLAYMLGNKYNEAIETFESGVLAEETATFPAYYNLTAFLLDAYLKRQQKGRIPFFIAKIAEDRPALALRLQRYLDLSTANMEGLQKTLSSHPDSLNAEEQEVAQFLYNFKAHRKSPYAAGFYNALLPGAGYLYVGQVQSAITSFLLNAAFIAASWQFFERGFFAAGIITASLETGWYFGGIKGASLAAKQYNDAYYSQDASELMRRQKLFPVLMLEYAF
jgi:tetratricopeptide (TPR) repeat protein